MPIRTITVAGRTWRVMPSGFTTSYVDDEHGLLFITGEGDAREVRVSRYSPNGDAAGDKALADLHDDFLAKLLAESQPSATAPETGYRKSPPTA